MHFDIHDIHSHMFLLILPTSLVELMCACGLTCRGLLAGDVGFDVWRQIWGFCVLAWGQVGRHGCPGCHWGCWIPSHRWTGITGHHSASAWLRNDDHKCLELQHIYLTRAGGKRVCAEFGAYPAHCRLREGVISSRSSPWQTALAIERLRLLIRQVTWQILINPFTELKKGLHRHLIHQIVYFISKTIYHLLSYWELLRLHIVPKNN